MKDLLGRLLFLSMLLLGSACGDSALFERNESITNRSWSYSDVPTFDFHIADAGRKYDIWVNVRHTNDYKYSNLFILLRQHGPGLKDTVQRYEIKLAEADGRWTGSSAGNLYASERLVKKDVMFPDTGHYSFAIEQNMRENPLKEIADVGLKVVEKP
jgi:gliding motility-associated lipoprotein GldH